MPFEVSLHTKFNLLRARFSSLSGYFVCSGEKTLMILVDNIYVEK